MRWTLHFCSSGQFARPCEKWSSNHFHFSLCLVFRLPPKKKSLFGFGDIRPSLPATLLPKKTLAPTLVFHTGQVAYNQCVGAFELEAFELRAAAHGFIWGVSESQRDSTRRAGEPKQLTGRGWKLLRAADRAIHSLSSAVLITLLQSRFDLVLIQKMLLNGVLICHPKIFFVYITLHYLSFHQDLIKGAEIFWTHQINDRRC